MSSTDDRVVNMRFNNAEFKKGAADTAKSLADVNAAVNSAGKSKGLTDLSAAMGRVQVTASNMSVAVAASIATIASQATQSAMNLVKSVTLDPILQGFNEYGELLTKQNVIMNATGKTAGEVKGYLNELNAYSDKTIYSFSNMTASITKFVNAGISLPDSVTSIKGIANAAAFAGASTEEANRAMYAFSQSMSTGYIMLNDWMQIENANMATMGFKEQLLEAAVAAGTLTRQGDKYITTSGKVVTATAGWREGLQEQWATTEVMNTALAKYTDLNTKLGREATKAATEIRTFGAFMDTLKESVGSGWAKIFESLFGNLNQATKLWTGLGTSVGGVVESFFHWASTTLEVWRNMGGFEKTIQGFKNLLSPLGAIFDVIGAAMRAAFPSGGKGTGKILYGLSAGFEAVTRPLQLFADLIRMATPIVTVFFQALNIIARGAQDAVGFMFDMNARIRDFIDLPIPSGGGIVGFIKDMIAAIGDAIGKISDLMSKGKSLGEAIGSFSFNMPSLPDMPSLPSMPDMPSMSGIFDGGGASGAIAALTGGVEKLTGGVSDLGDKADDVTAKGSLFGPNTGSDTQMAGVTESLGDSVNRLKSWGENILDFFKWVGGGLSNLGGAFMDFIKGINIDDVVRAFNMAVITTFMISLIRLFGVMRKGAEVFKEVVNLPGVFAGVLESAGDALGSFQTAARAKLIIAIAIAIGVLALALIALSFVPADKLRNGLIGLGVLLAMTTIALKQIVGAVEDMDGDKVTVKMAAISLALIALGVAMLFLAGALVIMNFVDWSSVAKGLAMMVVMLAGIAIMGERMNDAAGKNLLGAAVAMMAIAGAMLVLSAALLVFKLINWDELLKGGATMAAMSVGIALMAKLPAKSLAGVALAMLSLSVALNLLAIALLVFKLVDWESIAKLSVVLGALALSLGLMMLVGGPVAVSGMIGLGVGLMAIATAGLILNSVDWSSIGKIAVILLALTLATAAFGAVASFAAGPIALLGLGVLALGAGVALLGLGMFTLVAAFTAAIALGAAGAAAFAAIATAAGVAIAAFIQSIALQAPVIKDALLTILQNFIDGIVQSVPMVIKGIKDLFNAVVKELVGPAKAQKMEASGKSMIGSLINGLIKDIPQMVKKGAEIVIAFLKGLTSKAGELASAAVGLVVSVLQGIAKKAGDLVKAGVDLVVKLAEGLGNNLGELVNAGVNLIVDFLNALAGAIRTRSGAVGGGIANVVGAMASVGIDMVKGLISGITGMIGDAMGAIENLAGSVVGAAKNILKIFSPSRVFRDIGKFVVMGLTDGIQKNAASAISAVAKMVGGQIAMANELVDRMIQKMDQKVIAANARAQGLAAAAIKAGKLAEETKKNKKDDKAAAAIGKQATKADKKAKELQRKAEAAMERQDRAKEFRQSDLLGKAEMRSEDAQKALAKVKNAEQEAQAALVQANALEKQAKAEGVSVKQRKELLALAEKLRAGAKEDAKRANEMLKTAKELAQEALKYQRMAGAEAARSYQQQYRSEAEAAKRADAFEKMTDAEKAAQLRIEAAQLDAQSKADLARAKKLAFTDIEAANALAARALDGAEAARNALKQAADYEEAAAQKAKEESEKYSGLIDVDPTEMAARAFKDYSKLFDAASAAAASAPVLQFTQNNTSPDSLSASEIYRQTSNLVSFASQKLQPA